MSQAYAPRISAGPFVRWWLPVILYVTVILIVSSQPRLKPPLHFQNADKLFHSAEYLGLGLLLARAIHGGTRIRQPLVAALAALAIGVCVAAGDEYWQSFVPGRDSSVYDLLADTAGCAVAQFVYVWFARE